MNPELLYCCNNSIINVLFRVNIKICKFTARDNQYKSKINFCTHPSVVSFQLDHNYNNEKSFMNGEILLQISY